MKERGYGEVPREIHLRMERMLRHLKSSEPMARRVRRRVTEAPDQLCPRIACRVWMRSDLSLYLTKFRWIPAMRQSLN